LRNNRLGCEVRELESCTSTNDIAMQWARNMENPAPHGAVVVAQTQSAGRGRLGRQWHSPAGANLYVSCVLRTLLPPDKVPPLTLCAGLAVCETVNTLGVGASIKWPNDVLVGKRKLAGILTEMISSSQHGKHQVDAVIIGIGLNVNTETFPEPLQATSMCLEGGHRYALPSVLGALLVALQTWTEAYIKHGITALEEAFAKHSILANQRVKAKVGKNMIEGEVLSLGHDGSLLLRDKHNMQHRVIAGEVEIL